jgi:hypothetical protein
MTHAVRGVALVDEAIGLLLPMRVRADAAQL